ncbi:MAG: flagellar filament capping protein FliD [Gammaproteobacteria bacterium]|nr:flagellar filament capping protein FliD [Gammaproteobacteria bacterium]
MATISSPGSGSGIDVAGLVSSIISAESEPAISRLDLRATELQTRFSATGQLKSSLSQFSDAVDRIRSTSELAGRHASVSPNGDQIIAEASAGNTAALGAYSLDVSAIAKAHKLASSGVASAETTVGSGTLVIGSGNSAFSVEVAASDTLADIANAINLRAGDQTVSATLLTVDDGSGSQTKLVLSAEQTGVAQAISFTAVDTDVFHNDAFGLSALTVNTTELQAASDASVTIDGQTITSGTNTLQDALTGVTIELKAAAPGSPVQLEIAADTSQAGREITNFVEAFNGLRNAINALTNFDPTSGEHGILLGDSATRGLDNALRRELGVQGSGPIGSLAELGIATTTDGTLSVDLGRLNDALSQDLEGITELLTSSEGLGARLHSVISDFLGPQGVFEAREEAISARLDVIDAQRQAIARRMSSREQSLTAQFSAMDALVSQLQDTSNFLTQQFNALEGLLLSRNGNQ